MGKIMKHIKLESMGYKIDLKLRDRVTVINGESGSGKSFLYQLISRVPNLDNVLCINYESIRVKANYYGILNTLREIKNSIVIIDQADDIQREHMEIMEAVDNDNNNTFIIMGRNPKVMCNISDIAEMNIHDKTVEIKYSFPEPLV